MAKQVIDLLEMIEIDQMQGKQVIAAPCAGDQSAHALGQKDAVGQIGQLVMMRQMAQMRLHALAPGDVERRGQHAGDLAANACQRGFDGQKGAHDALRIGKVLLETGQGPGGVEDDSVKRLVSGPVFLAKHRGRLSCFQLFAVESGEFGLVGVDKQQVAFGIGGADHGGQSVDDLRQALGTVAQGVFARAQAMVEFALQRHGARCQFDLLAAHFQHVACAGDKFVMIDRRMQEIGGTSLQGSQPERALVIDGDDHHRHIDDGWQKAQAPDKFGTVQMRHLVVGDDQVGLVGTEPIQGGHRIAKSLDDHAFLDQGGELGENIAVGDSVVDDDDTGHRAHPDQTRPASLPIRA